MLTSGPWTVQTLFFPLNRKAISAAMLFLLGSFCLSFLRPPTVNLARGHRTVLLQCAPTCALANFPEMRSLGLAPFSRWLLEPGLTKYRCVSPINHLYIGCNYHRWLTKKSIINKNKIEQKGIELDNSDCVFRQSPDSSSNLQSKAYSKS